VNPAQIPQSSAQPSSKQNPFTGQLEQIHFAFRTPARSIHLDKVNRDHLKCIVRNVANLEVVHISTYLGFSQIFVRARFQVHESCSQSVQVALLPTISQLG
jgi:hypothetical protein